MHLANLKRQGKIRDWQDRDIEAGTEWDTAIKQQLESADIILLLITPFALASDYRFDRKCRDLRSVTTKAASVSSRLSPLMHSLTPDFANSGSALLRELGEEATLAGQKDPANLLTHLLESLFRCRMRPQIHPFLRRCWLWQNNFAQRMGCGL